MAISVTGSVAPTSQLGGHGFDLHFGRRALIVILVLGCVAVNDLAAQQRTPEHDFDTLRGAGNNRPRGIWSDGTTMWISDDSDDKLYAYTLATKVRDPGKDFDTLSAAGNTVPGGLWSDGTTMWVRDYVDDKLYAYTLATKARDPGKDFDTLIAAGNNHPHGLWSDGTTMWVADTADDKLYAYTLATKARDSGKDFDTLIAAGHSPSGLWSDGTTMWISDASDDKLYAYTLATKARDPGKDFDTLIAAGNVGPIALWSDGMTMWVTDWREEKLYAYAMPRQGGTNRPPRPTGSISAQTLAVSDGAASVNVAWYFTDPDGDALTYTVRSNGNSIVTAAVSGRTVRLTPVGAGTAMVTVTARDPGGLSAMQSIAVTVTAPGITGFTDDPLVPGMTRVRAVHFRELRTWIDAVRVQAGLRAFAWTDRTLTPRVTPIRRVHLTELRTALDAAYTAAGQRAPTYTDARVTAGTTPIRARHITELRSAVLALDNCREALGPVARTVTRSLSWTESCPSVHYSNGRYARYYSFTLRGGARVTIDLTSSSVDTYLALRNGSGTGMGLIESDNDGGSGRNARITRSLSRGTYTIEATTFRGRVTGPFTLKLAVDSSGGPALEGEVTRCRGNYIATGLASVSMGGILRARRSVANVVVTGTVNGRHLGIRSLGSIAAGGSKNFSMSSVIPLTGTRIRCVASWRFREVAGANAETESGGVTGVATIEGELR